MTVSVRISSHHCGPPRSGHGGWSCGVVADAVDGPAEVMLRLPPPLDVDLDLVDVSGSGTVPSPAVELRAGDDVVATGRRVDDVDIEAPPAVSSAEAEAAEAAYKGLVGHPFPTCFACGADRGEGDGLRLFTGAVPGRPGLVASRWTPHEAFAVDGTLPEALVWAALDCPSGWAHIDNGVLCVLGRMAARIDRVPDVGEPLVIVGRADAIEGRKHHASSALRTSDGELLAVARATWIQVG